MFPHVFFPEWCAKHSVSIKMGEVLRESENPRVIAGRLPDFHLTDLQQP